ncbi:unnamed protein product, partial [Brachionus calyciflorus]
FGENIRVLEWIFKRTENDSTVCKETPIGFMPKDDSFDLEGLQISKEEIQELFSLDKNFWLNELNDIKNYFEEYVSDSTPQEIYNQLNAIRERFEKSN